MELFQIELVTFFSWVDFCDDLICKSQGTISESVAADIRRNFFTKTFEKELCITFSHNETSPEMNDVAMDKEVESFDGHCVSLKLSLLSQIWLHIQSDGLAQEFSKWLVGNDLHTCTFQRLL